MTAIKDITAREILDSRGNPTIEATVFTDNCSGTAAVPSGASKGTNEALELRDGGKRFKGLGVNKSLRIINRKIRPLLLGKDVTKQREIDQLLIEKDGTEQKEKFGANSIMAVSLACARAAAAEQKKELYGYINSLLEMKRKMKMPQAFFNILNGGKHADSKLSIQEFMIVPKLKSFRKNLQAASEIYHALKKEIQAKYGNGSTNVGDEGGFSPVKIDRTEEALTLLNNTIKKTGYGGKVGLALDCAASGFYHEGKYHIDGKKMSSMQLLDHYSQLIKKYNLCSIEDPFEEEDFTSFSLLKEKSGIQIVGDDLTVTNIERIEAAIREKSCNCLLLKVNQIGTLTEAMDAAELAWKNKWEVMVSHRSGETEDTFIADLAVGLGCGMIKAGAPCRGERIAKYNRLLKIEEEFNKI